MASLSPSASEGEIVEIETDKASTAQPASKDMRFDRPSRKSTSSSTSDSSARFDGARYRSKSRSRSPYRHHLSQGKKRRWEDDNSGRDRQETRRFKVHYEDSRRNRVSYADIDREDSHGSRHDYRNSNDRNRNRDRYRRSRSRSRSPYRHKKAERAKESRSVAVVERSSPPRKQTNGDMTTVKSS